MLSLKVSGKLFGKRPDGGEAESAVFSQTFEVEDTLNADFDAAAMLGAFMADELQAVIDSLGVDSIDFRVSIVDIEDVTKFEYRVFDQVQLQYRDGMGETQAIHAGEIGTVRQVSADGDFDVEVVFQDGESCWCSNDKVTLYRRAQPAIPPKVILYAEEVPTAEPQLETPKVGDRVFVYRIQPFFDEPVNQLGTIVGSDGDGRFFDIRTDGPTFSDSQGTGPWVAELGVDFDVVVPFTLPTVHYGVN